MVDVKLGAAEFVEVIDDDVQVGVEGRNDLIVLHAVDLLNLPGVQEFTSSRS
jgi:hypothetical protein